ncbi:hypothetical protein DS2_16014 [Catenovulum agarivorans DS-2]|uniref:LTD domain-containing protein n=1 Tax=Catenovulum agarivorans DS-2 TaxID=1328313 RepID=W7QTJ5_9ALTE|nr:DUF6701 domain-containing protein [Catenovulum agarivorans]EWH08755.1 hypothetical protein DS2_16014 [Catenovulum agarivorans DS-2]
MKYFRLLLAFSCLILVNLQLQAATCDEVFPSAISSNYNQGQLTMNNTAHISNEPTPNQLPFKKAGQIVSNSCGAGVTCDISGSSASSINMPNFQTSPSSTYVGVHSSLSVIFGANNGSYNYQNKYDYGNVGFSSEASGSFSAANTSYRFKNFALSNNTELTIPPGDYYIENLSLSSNSKITLDTSKGSGSVRFHILKSLSIHNTASINLNGDPNHFVFFIHAQNTNTGLNLSSNAKLFGLVYVNASKQGNNVYGSTSMHNTAYLKGRLSTANLHMTSDAHVEFAGDPNQATLGDVCSQSVSYTCPDLSSDSSLVTINEFHIENGNNWIELYVSENASSAINLNNWQLQANGAGAPNQFSFELFSSNTTYQPGEYIVFAENINNPNLSHVPNSNLISKPDVDWHNNFQEILLLDTNNEFVHYLRYPPSGHNGNEWTDCESEYPASSTIIDAPGNNSTACALTDGSKASNQWDSSCGNSTPGASNASPTLVAHYQFDTGSGQTAVDSSSYSRDAILGNSNSTDSQDPNWMCENTGYYLDFNKSANQRITTASFTPPADGVITFWMKVDALPTSRNRIFGFNDGFEARWESGNTIYWDINKTGSNNSIKSTITNDDLGQWTHIAVSYSASNNTWAVYKNGTQVASGSETLTAQAADVFTIGGSTWKAGSQSFNGAIDDFRLYSGSLTGQQIADLAATAPVDCVQVDHYEITHDSSALTCSTASVTVKACRNANCDLYNQVTNATLTKTIGNSTSVIDANSFTGSKSVSLSQSSAATITLGLTNLSPSAPVTCNGNGNCQLVFSDSGFVVSSANIESCTQGSITIQALKTDQSQNCAPAWTGSRTIQMLLNHVNKQGNASMQVGNNNYSLGQTHSITTQFDNSAQATLDLTYADAGAVTVQISDPNSVLISNSNTVNFYPNQLVVSTSSATNNMAVNTDFNLEVSAQCSDTTVTPSYQPSQLQFDLVRAIPDPNLGGEEANLFYSAAGQVTSQAGFTDSIATTFSNGAYSYNQSKIDEYGQYQLQARDVNYLGLGNISSNTITLGTFIPAQLNIYAADEIYPNGFTDNRSQGQYQNVNLINTYLGQSFSYASQPAVAVIGIDALGNALHNYTSALGTANLSADLAKITASTTDNSIILTSNLNAGSLTDNADGSFTYQFAAADSFQHQKSAANQTTAPFDTSISLSFATGAFFDANNGLIASTADSFIPSPANIVSARLLLSNNFGPETDNLTLPIAIESYNGSSWTTASTDNTTVLPSVIFTFGGQNHSNGQTWLNQYPISGGTNTSLLSPATNSNSITAQSGLLNFLFAAPGEGNQGTMTAQINLATYPYLQYDWDADVSLDSNITTELIWGIFRGNDRIINWREIY